MAKKHRKSRKGSQFERQFCKNLSLWWTGGKRDDVFWRSAGSGARATTRGKKGRGTAGHYGDVSATCAIGEPLMDLVTIELKRGYSTKTALDIVEKLPSSPVCKWEGFFYQAMDAWEQSGAFSWILVTQRDRREPMVWIPFDLAEVLAGVGYVFKPHVLMWSMIRRRPRTEGRLIQIIGTPLKSFLSMDAKVIRELSKTL